MVQIESLPQGVASPEAPVSKSKKSVIDFSNQSTSEEEKPPNDLLTAEQEIDLAKQIELGKIAAVQLSTDEDIDPELRSTLEQQLSLGQDAINTFIEKNKGLVLSVAVIYGRDEKQREDYFQAGNIGLMRAINKFDYTRGARFGTYAIQWIKQSIQTERTNYQLDVKLPGALERIKRRVEEYKLQRVGATGKIPTPTEIAAALQLRVSQVEAALAIPTVSWSLDAPRGNRDTGETYSDMFTDGNAPNPEDVVIEHDTKKRLLILVSKLPDREKKVLYLHFGLTEDSEEGKDPLSYEQIGLQLGVAKQRAHQIAIKAFNKLREQFGDELKTLLRV